MVNKKKTKIYILDTSAVLSGKPINLGDCTIITAQGISDELNPGGRDYQSFQFLIEKGLTVHSPTNKSFEKVKVVSKETGDNNRLSTADIEILALALDFYENDEKEAIILSDDYSLQNVAHALKIKFESISQSGITKRFKWSYRCRGCGKKFKDNIKICPICAAEIKTIVSKKQNIN